MSGWKIVAILLASVLAFAMSSKERAKGPFENLADIELLVPKTQETASVH